MVSVAIIVEKTVLVDATVAVSVVTTLEKTVLVDFTVDVPVTRFPEQSYCWLW